MNPLFKLNYGGKRPGAGRPHSGNIQMTVRLKPETRKMIRRMKGRWHTQGQVIDRAVAQLDASRRAAELAQILR